MMRLVGSVLLLSLTLVLLLSLDSRAQSDATPIVATESPTETAIAVPTEIPTEAPVPTTVPPTPVPTTPAPELTVAVATAAVPTATSAPRTPTPSKGGAAPQGQLAAACDFRFQDDFESGNMASWTTNDGIVVQSSQVYQGGFAAEATGGGGVAAYARKNLSCVTNDLYYRIRVKVISKDAQALHILKLRSNTNATLAGIFISSSGKLSFRNNNPANDHSLASTRIVTDGQWHDVQVHMSVNGASGFIEVWFDGQPVSELTRTEDLGTTSIGRVQLGENATDRSFDVLFDDVCVDSAICSMASPPPIITPTPTPTPVPPTVAPTVTPTSTIAPTVTPTATTAAPPTATFTTTATTASGCWSPFTDGFESGSLANWPLVSGLAPQQTDVANGAWAAQGFSTTGTASFARKPLSCGQTSLFMRVRFKIVSKDTTSLYLLKFRSLSPDASIAGVYVGGNRALAFRNDVAAANVVSTSTFVSLDAWHTLQVHLDIPGQKIEIWYDGALVPELSRTGQNFGATQIGRAQFGDNSTGHLFDFRFDDFCVDVVACADVVTPPPDPTTAPTVTATATASPTATFTPPPASCVTFTDGFESGNLASWTAVNFGVQQSEVLHGEHAARATSPNPSGVLVTSYARKSLGCASTDIYGRVGFRILTPTLDSVVNTLRFRTAADGSIGGIFVSQDGRLAHRSDIAPGLTIYSNVMVSPLVWHEVQFHYTIRGTDPTAADDSLEVWFDGSPVPELSYPTGTGNGINLGINAVGRLQLGENQAGRTFDVAFDDVCIDTARCSDLSIPPPTPTPSPTLVPVPTLTGGPPAVIMAAGDISCGLFSSGGKCVQSKTSDLIVADQPDAVLLLGDNQYECGDLADFMDYFDPTWGRFKGLIRPAIGNHEYHGIDCRVPTDNGAMGYWSYFGAAANPLKTDCTKSCAGYYSFDLGDWHIIAINSNCSQGGGCAAGSAQEKWLRADLAAHRNSCTLAYMHHPLFSSGQIGDNASMQPMWQAMYEAGVDVVLAGHDHNYERFDPQTPGGAPDAAFGIREFIVGTGGRNVSRLGSIKPNSVIRDTNTFGVIKMTLRVDGYDWQFLPIAGSTFTDSGSADCHDAPGTMGSAGGSTSLVSATLQGDRQPWWSRPWLYLLALLVTGLAAIPRMVWAPERRGRIRPREVQWSGRSQRRGRMGVEPTGAGIADAHTVLKTGEATGPHPPPSHRP